MNEMEPKKKKGITNENENKKLFFKTLQCISKFPYLKKPQL